MAWPGWHRTQQVLQGPAVSTEEATRERARVQNASRIAAAVALAVALAGLFVVFRPVIQHNGDATLRDPLEVRTGTKTYVITADGRTATMTVTEPDQSMIERILGKDGLALLRFVIVLGAGFVVGAMVQRTILGYYAMKLGPLGFPDLPRRLAETAETTAKANADALQIVGSVDGFISLLAGEVDDLDRRLKTVEGDGT